MPKFMTETVSLISQREIENRIFPIRGVLVMLDSHLSELYDVDSKRLNEQVKRKPEEILRSQSATLNDNR